MRRALSHGKVSTSIRKKKKVNGGRNINHRATKRNQSGTKIPPQERGVEKLARVAGKLPRFGRHVPIVAPPYPFFSGIRWESDGIVE